MSINTKLIIRNANGLARSKPEVEHYIKTNQVDILLVSETHFTSRSHFTSPGYKIINALHPGDRIREGASIIIRRGIQYEDINKNKLYINAIRYINLVRGGTSK